MKGLSIASGILVEVGVVVFLLGPVLSWESPVITDAYYRAQVSPWFYFFRCGVVSNLGIVYIATNQVLPAPSGIHDFFWGTLAWSTLVLWAK